MSESDNSISCSFCGCGPETEGVDLIITAPNASICWPCVGVCCEIAEDWAKAKAADVRNFPSQPAEQTEAAQ